MPDTRSPGLAFDPARRQERLDRMLASPSGIASRLRQAQAFADRKDDEYVPQDPREIMADVLGMLRMYLDAAGVK